MSLSRRRALKITSLSALVAAFGPAALALSKRSKKDDRFSGSNLALYGNLSRATFEPLIGMQFTASSPTQSARDLMLISVEGFPAAATSTASSPAIRATTGALVGHRLPPRFRSPSSPLQGVQVNGFSLRFSGAGDALPQDTYTIDNRILGSFSLFLVPSANGNTTPTCTAVFSFVP